MFTTTRPETFDREVSVIDVLHDEASEQWPLHPDHLTPGLYVVGPPTPAGEGRLYIGPFPDSASLWMYLEEVDGPCAGEALCSIDRSGITGWADVEYLAWHSVEGEDFGYEQIRWPDFSVEVTIR